MTTKLDGRGVRALVEDRFTFFADSLSMMVNQNAFLTHECFSRPTRVHQMPFTSNSPKVF